MLTKRDTWQLDVVNPRVCAVELQSCSHGYVYGHSYGVRAMCDAMLSSYNRHFP